MKTKHFICRSSVFFIFATVATLNSADQTENSKKVLPPSNAVVAITVTPPKPNPDQSAVAADHSATSVGWADIKNCTYEMRGQFFAGLQYLEAALDTQINSLAARRVAMTDSADTKNLDSIVQEMSNARFFLRSMGELLGKAPAQSWDGQKARVGMAWLRSQEAYAKIKNPAMVEAKRTASQPGQVR